MERGGNNIIQCSSIDLLVFHGALPAYWLVNTRSKHSKTRIMKDKIKQTILYILEQKRREGDVLPFATSIEVAHLLNMNALDVEKIADGIEGIVKGRTLNHEWYYE